MVIFESSNSYNFFSCLSNASLRTDQSAANSVLFFEAGPCVKVISFFVLSFRYTTPLAPPSGGSPWLAPSKYPQGHVLKLFLELLLIDLVLIWTPFGVPLIYA